MCARATSSAAGEDLLAAVELALEIGVDGKGARDLDDVERGDLRAVQLGHVTGGAERVVRGVGAVDRHEQTVDLAEILGFAHDVPLSARLQELGAARETVARGRDGEEEQADQRDQGHRGTADDADGEDNDADRGRPAPRS